MYEKFEALLKENNTNIFTVARETGITSSTLYEWRNGKYTPKVDKLQKIASYFGVPIAYFLEND